MFSDRMPDHKLQKNFHVDPKRRSLVIPLYRPGINLTRFLKLTKQRTKRSCGGATSQS